MGSGTNVKDKITSALPVLFNFDFPIWLSNYKSILEKKIVMHYFNYEIGFETPQLFQFFLEERLNMIMPYYNQLYASVLVYDITKNIGISITDSENNNKTITNNGSIHQSGTTDQQNNTTNTNVNVQNTTAQKVDYDMPQSKNNTNTDYASFLTDDTNAINGNNTDNINAHVTNSNDGTTTNNATTNDNATISKTHSESGNNIPIAELIMKHRETLINIDNQIIEDLKDLFMLIY
jgi:hypothetical protein